MRPMWKNSSSNFLANILLGLWVFWGMSFTSPNSSFSCQRFGSLRVSNVPAFSIEPMHWQWRVEVFADQVFSILSAPIWMSIINLHPVILRLTNSHPQSGTIVRLNNFPFFTLLHAYCRSIDFFYFGWKVYVYLKTLMHYLVGIYDYWELKLPAPSMVRQICG